MGKTLGEIDEMSIVEFREWRLYERIEPFGDRRGDLQAATVACTLANIHRSQHARPFKLDDFMHNWEPAMPPKVQTPEEQLQIMLALQALSRQGRTNA